MPHGKTGYHFCRAFEADGTWDARVTALRVEVRTTLGRDPTPSGACIDSPSAKTAHGGAEVGVDEYTVIATTAKGERLDRPELVELEQLLRSRRVDVLVCEDIGRMVRGTEAVRLCGVAVDHGVRVIAPNDCVDTADDEWEADVISACRDHVGHNAHTSKRLKQKLLNRFKKFGGAMARPVYGYVLPPGARTYADWRKDPAAEAVYAEWFARLRDKPNCAAVADWLNATGVPVGPYARRATWDGAMVRRITHNPVLKGLPERGRKRTVKQHETGRRVSVANPDGPAVWPAPHLAFVTPDEFDAVNAALDAANEGVGRKPVGGLDPLFRVPRHRSRFPGRLARCGYCGREYVWGGNGVAGNLMCGGTRDWKCWNSVGFPGVVAARLVAAAITSELARLDGFDAQFRGLVADALRADGPDAGKRADLDRKAVALARQKRNLLDTLKEVGPTPDLVAELKAVQADEAAVGVARRELEARHARPVRPPASVAELRGLFEMSFADLAADSFEFADRLRLLVPEFHVGLVRRLDGGKLLPRAVITLDLAGVAPGLGAVPGVAPLLRTEVVLDLFEPTQREAIREEVVRRAAAGQDQRAIAAALGVTQAAVSKAVLLDRAMRAAGLSSPYVPVTGPPPSTGKMKRSAHERYRFDPLPGYPRPVG